MTPQRSHEGVHPRPDTSTFTVFWNNPGSGEPSWVWCAGEHEQAVYGLVPSHLTLHGPYSTSELAYDAGLSKDC